MDLKKIGWNKFFEKKFKETYIKKCALEKESFSNEELFPARVATAQREIYWIFSKFGEHRAEISGKLRFNALSMSDFPVVGDWVVTRLSPEGNLAIIEGILPRITKLSRKSAGSITDEQVLVSNIDIVFIINGLDGDYNLRRIERYLTLTKNTNVNPVILLNKLDLCRNVKDRIKEIKSIAPKIPVHTLSALKNKGIQNLKKYFKEGTTTAFLGSSGVGKSTIINRLLGEERLEVGEVREWDSRGRHITARRELIILPKGGIVIDNPGLRELQLWSNENNLEDTFIDIKVLTSLCRFRDCKHTNEPGCAVRSALEKGELDYKRFQNFIKLKKELRYLAARKEKIKSRNEKIQTEKKISKLSKQIQKHKRSYKF